jgi:hypothetical protein
MMAFRRVSRQPGVKPKRSVRLRNYGAAGPSIVVPIDVAALAGFQTDDRVDLMIDADATPKKIAVVSKGEDIKVALQRVAGPLIINASRLREFVPRMRTTPVQYEIGEVDGRAALILLVPQTAHRFAARAAREASEAQGHE